MIYTMAIAQQPLVPLLIKIPADLKRRIDRVAKKGKRTEFMIQAIEYAAQRQARIAMIDKLMKEKKRFHISMPDRNWPTDRLMKRRHG